MPITSNEEILCKVKELLVECLFLDMEPYEVEDDEALFDGDLGLDSVSVLELVTAIEDYFSIEIEDEEFSSDIFISAKALAQFITQKINNIT